MKDLDALSRITGIREDLFRSALNVTPAISCTAATIEEARVAFYAATYGSDKALAALRRWIELCMTVEDVVDVYNVMIPGAGAAERAAYAKWNELSLKQVEAATTVAEAKAAYETAPVDSDAELAALRKMYDLF